MSIEELWYNWVYNQAMLEPRLFDGWGNLGFVFQMDSTLAKDFKTTEGVASILIRDRKELFPLIKIAITSKLGGPGKVLRVSTKCSTPHTAPLLSPNLTLYRLSTKDNFTVLQRGVSFTAPENPELILGNINEIYYRHIKPQVNRQYPILRSLLLVIHNPKELGFVLNTLKTIRRGLSVIKEAFDQSEIGTPRYCSDNHWETPLN